MIEDSLNIRILDWWYQLPEKLRGNRPSFIHSLNKEAQILFVGLNPSGSTKEKPAINSISDSDIKRVMELEHRNIFGGVNQEGQYKSYYGPLSSIANKLQMQYEHCDLFHMSYRTSKVVIAELFDRAGELKDIHKGHIEVFCSILNHVDPKIVITNNVVTASILETYLDLTFDPESLMHKDRTGTYFFLSGIMSYGRLTRYDKERLFGIINKVIDC